MNMKFRSGDEIAGSFTALVGAVVVCIVIGGTIATIHDIRNLKLKKDVQPTGTMIETTIEQTEEIKEGDSKVFQEGEHWYTLLLKSKDCDPCVLNDCETPEGYRAEGVVPYCIKEGDKVIDEGFRIDYSNTEPVVVYAQYNEQTGKYDYEHPGYVLQEVKTKTIG